MYLKAIYSSNENNEPIVKFNKKLGKICYFLARLVVDSCFYKRETKHNIETNREENREREKKVHNSKQVYIFVFRLFNTYK